MAGSVLGIGEETVTSLRNTQHYFLSLRPRNVSSALSPPELCLSVFFLNMKFVERKHPVSASCTSTYVAVRSVNSGATVVTADQQDAKSSGHFSADAHLASPLHSARLVTLFFLKLLVWALSSYHHFLLFLSVFLFALLWFMYFRALLLSFYFD